MREKSNNTISIITASFNQGQFLEETIISVLSQKGDFYIDYIIADGGSTDNSVEIIKKYNELLKTKKYPVKCMGIEFRWRSHRDKGQTNAINEGFKLAKGDILAWINSDDYYQHGTFDYIIKKFHNNLNIDLFYGDMYLIDSVKNEKILQKTQQGNYNEMVKLTGKNWYIFQPSTFFTKRIIKKIGLLDERFYYAFDYDFFIRIFKNEKTLYCPEILANFRIWQESKTFLQQAKFKNEKKTIRKKHNLIIFDPKTINRITAHPPFSTLRNNFPVFYKFCKNISYHILNNFKYRKKNTDELIKN